MQDKSFTPDWVSPPGDTIKYILAEKGIDIYSFSAKMHLTEREVDDMMKGVRRITPEIASNLSKILGSTESFWTHRDEQYVKECNRLGKPIGSSG